MKRWFIREPAIKRLALVKQGANRQRRFLLKSDGQETAVAYESQLIKEAGPNWRVAYFPVAVPDAEEGQGLLKTDDGDVDVWEADEIAKAAHGFLASGPEIIGEHFDAGPAGGVQLVESAVALADFEVGDPAVLIKEGTWYVGLEFENPQLRAAVESGEIDAVSVEGLADRVLSSIAKGALERVPGKQNWVDRVGGFPPGNWIYRAAIHIHEKGASIGTAIATAVNAAKKMCSTGDTNWPGHQQVNAPSQADACKAVAEWEAMKARAAAKGLAKFDGDWTAIPDDEEGVTAVLDTLSSMAQDEQTGLLRRIAKAIGARPDDDDCVDCSSPDYPADVIAKREFTSEKRDKLSGTGAALPDGSFPIENCGDVRNAVQAIGRASDPARAKAHTIRRAKSLGCTDALPDGWKIAKGLDEDPGIVGNMEIGERVEALEGKINELTESFTGLTAEDGPLAKLGTGIDTLAKRIPEPKPEEPTPTELKAALAKVEEAIGEKLSPLAERIESLEEGGSSQPADLAERGEKTDKRESTQLAKEDKPLVGILFDYED